MNTLGISCGSHDAAIAAIKNNEIVFASQSERYSKNKNDLYLNRDVILDALYSLDYNVDSLCFYENILNKKTRQFFAGQYYNVFVDKPLSSWYNNIKNIYTNYKLLSKLKIHQIDHHKSHAALAFASPYNKAIVLVIDAIGEWDTISIWLYNNSLNRKLIKLESYSYPQSLGLFYTAFTDYVGLKANEEEYIFMGMAAFGKPIYKDMIRKYLFNSKGNIKINLHTGIPKDLLNININDFKTKENIASSVQDLTEEYIFKLLNKIKYYQDIYKTKNLIYSGGIALNCVANSKIQKEFSNMWIFPNPGDSGSSLGCALAYLNNKTKFDSVYLGYNICYNSICPNDISEYLLNNKICGIALGKAEFGPRALGNRSLLADPRGNEIKDKVNEIKKRDKFRPFAPIIMEEYFKEYFEVPNNIMNSSYMQYVYKCKYPDKFPAIVHIDGTSRVQTINEKQNAFVYNVLKSFYNKTGCPMLLNTSLNIKGKPIINDINDAINFERKYNIKVFY